MKLNSSVILIAGLFSFLALISFLLSTPSYQPYSPEIMYQGMYPYEGFRSNDSTSTSYPEYKSMDDERVETTSPLKKVQGFSGLLSSVDYVAKPNDFLSETRGSSECRGSSYGYSNSRGFLCMSPEQVQLLTTRGGNA